MILDKLIEKKDIQAYISWRLRTLQLDLKKVPLIENPRKREPAKRQIKGRILELRLMRDVIHRGVKRQSMIACANFYRSLRKAEGG